MEKCIFWDFDGTLVLPNERFLDALNFSVRSAGYEIDRGVIRELLKTVFPWLNYHVSYPDRTGEWWESFLDSLTPFYGQHGIEARDRVKINSVFKDRIINRNDYELYEDTKCVLTECVSRGYKNYLLSNNYPELTLMIRDLGIEEYFTDFIISSRVGYEKPRAELFDYAKRFAGTDSAIMVGDNPIADIEGGAAAGFRTVLVHRDAESRADYTFATLKEILGII